MSSAPTTHDLYLLLHTGNAGDLEFYERAAAGARSVLELGAGSGRIALALARAGHEVVGVELDSAFVAEARENLDRLEPGTLRGSLRLVQADMRTLELGERFDRVFLPYSVLYALGGRAQVLETLQRVRHHLEPEGELWLDVYPMDDFHAACLAGEAPDADEERDEVFHGRFRDQDCVVFERSTLDVAAQRLDVSYEAEVDGRVIARDALAHHYLLSDQIESCLAEAGLEQAAVFGGFSGEPSGEDADLLIICAVVRASS